MAPVAVLFDLDDTLSDHLGSVRAGLRGVQGRFPDAFGALTPDEMERRYTEILEETHTRLLAGGLTLADARGVRTQRFYADHGVTLDLAQAEVEYRRYRVDYDAAADVVAGTRELLDALDERGVRMGIITNNLVTEQHAKLHNLDLFDRFEMLTISEEVGVAKPDPHIFEVALERMDLAADQVVVIGDSLTSDVAGSLSYGIAVVWLDRREVGPQAAPAGVRAVISRDLSDTDRCLEALLG